MKASETIVGQWYESNSAIYLRVPSQESGKQSFVRRAHGALFVVTISLDSAEFAHLPDCTGYDYEPPAPAPVPIYRQFASADELEPFRSTWIIDLRKGHVIRRIWSYDDVCVNGETYEYAFANWTFEDGTPFGIKESTDAAP